MKNFHRFPKNSASHFAGWSNGSGISAAQEHTVAMIVLVNSSVKKLNETETTHETTPALT